MGGILSCCLAEALCCAGTGALQCLCCSIPCKTSTSTRLLYTVQFIIAIALAWALSHWGHVLASHSSSALTDSCREACFDYLAVYRVSLSLVIYHGAMCLLTIGVKSSDDPRGAIQNGLWPIKFLVWFGTLVGMFFIPASALLNYWIGAIVFAAIFILLQSVILVDFGWTWSASWVTSYEATSSPIYKFLLFAFTLLAYGGVITATVLLSIFYATNHGCGLNAFFIAFNLILCLAVTLLAILPRVQTANPRSGIFPAAVLSAYATYLVASALASEPNIAGGFACAPSQSLMDNRNNTTAAPQDGLSRALVYVGLAITILALGYSAMSAGSVSLWSRVDDSSPTLITAGDGRDEVDGTVYSYAFFHLVFALAAMYMAAVITNWTALKAVDPATTSAAPDYSVDRGMASTWVKIATSWACFAVYGWTLVAPLLFPNRDFGAFATPLRASLAAQPRRGLATASVPPPPSVVPKKKGLIRRYGGKVILGLVATGTGVFAYEVYNARHPPQQFEWDHSKKTIAILGSGWAAASLLKELDTAHYNVVVVSPRNYFLFTPLLPSTTVGTVELRSIMMPMRYITRFKKRVIAFVEGVCNEIDVQNKTLLVEDNSEIVGEVSKQLIPYDYLVIACGAENATFGIPGVTQFACFLKEAWDAKKIRTRLMDCMETAAFAGQTEAEMERLLHMVVVGGGPTGVEYAAELYDFLQEDLASWYPELAPKIKITLVEALPHVLPSFSKELIDYTEKHFAEAKMKILSNTMVKEVKQKELIVQNPQKQIESIPYGLLVWATGNTARPVVAQLIKSLNPAVQNQRRGLVVDDFLKVKGADDVWGLGDASATKWAPTAQVASKQGVYLANVFNTLGNIRADSRRILAEGQDPEVIAAQAVKPFDYEHLGALAYIGSDKAIADLPGNVHIGGALTFWFWRSAYLNNLFSLRNRVLVAFDWGKKSLFGRDISRE
ncbi:NADH:ubiquinone oxidoreductase [Geranomyces variabilis]|nr:NADH:ubiquinone oxidoreductase [Geranomyces variabilis]